MQIPDVVRDAALFPADDLPDPPPGHPYRVVRRDGFVVGFLPGLSFGSVSVRAIPEDAIEETVAEVRRILADEGFSRGAWFVPEAATPSRLADRLLALGMAPYSEPPLEPRHAQLALVEAPEPAPTEVEARPAESLEEYRAATRVADEAFTVSDADRRALEKHETLIWELELASGSSRTFVALVDDEIVGYGFAVFGANAAHLSGGGTREDVRGRGAYRALVRARWDAAVERGTPALTVGAESMSRPILERLGFVNVGWSDCLSDQFA